MKESKGSCPISVIIAVLLITLNNIQALDFGGEKLLNYSTAESICYDLLITKHKSARVKIEFLVLQIESPS